MAKYGTVKYSQIKYGGESRPFNVRVILRNKKNDVAIMIDPKTVFHDFAEPYKYGQRKYGQAKYAGENRQPVLLDASWSYDRIGGCGGASVVLGLPYQSLDAIEEGTEIQIDVLDEIGELYTTWYRGEIATRSQGLSNISTVTLQAQGFVMQLDRVRLDALTFVDSNTEDIVKFIMDNFVIQDTQIKRTPDKGLIRAEGFVVDSITFNGSVMSAFRSLAEISGNAEWGVDNDKELFFKVRSTEVKNAYAVDELVSLSEASDFSSILNDFKLFGASGFTRSKVDIASQEKFGKRTSILQQSAISTNDTADQFIDGFLTDSKNPDETLSASVGNARERVEGIPPQGQVSLSVLGSSPFVKTSYQVETINYAMGNGDGLQVNIIGGRIKQDVTETVAYLNYRLDQLTDV
jgi:hypothetical protein